MTTRTTPDPETEQARRHGVVHSLILMANSIAQHIGVSVVGVASCYLVAAVGLLADRRVCSREQGEALLDQARQLFDMPDDQNTPRAH